MACSSPGLPAAPDPSVSPQLEVVIDFCCDFLFSWLDESNVVEVHRLADVYGLQQLNAKVHAYLLRNIQTLSRSEGYRMLPQDEVFRALSSNQLQVSSENQVYEAALHYHFSPEEVESDQVYLQVSAKVRWFTQTGSCQVAPGSLHTTSSLPSGTPADAGRRALLPDGQTRVAEAARPSQPVSAEGRRVGGAALPPAGDAAARPAESPHAAALHAAVHPGIRRQVRLQLLHEQRERLPGVPPELGGVEDAAGVSEPPDVQPGHRRPQQLRLPDRRGQEHQRVSGGVALLEVAGILLLISDEAGQHTAWLKAACLTCVSHLRVSRYDPRHNSWCSIQPLQQQRADHCVCVLGDHIYAVGGRNYRSELDSVERYDPQTNTWEFVRPLKRQVRERRRFNAAGGRPPPGGVTVCLARPGVRPRRSGPGRENLHRLWLQRTDLPQGDLLLRPGGQHVDRLRRGARGEGVARHGRPERPHLCHRWKQRRDEIPQRRGHGTVTIVATETLTLMTPVHPSERLIGPLWSGGLLSPRRRLVVAGGEPPRRTRRARRRRAGPAYLRAGGTLPRQRELHEVRARLQRRQRRVGKRGGAQGARLRAGGLRGAHAAQRGRQGQELAATRKGIVGGRQHGRLRGVERGLKTNSSCFLNGRCPGFLLPWRPRRLQDEQHV